MVFFPQVSPPKPYRRLSPPPYMLHAPTTSFFSILSPEQYWVRSTIINFLIMYFSPLSCHLAPLRPKYSPQHHILKHSQSIFLPQSEQPSFTPIQNNGQNYSSVYLHGIHFCNWVATRWQQYSTHIHTNNAENDTKQTIRTTQKFWKSAGHAPSLLVLPWHLPYN